MKVLVTGANGMVGRNLMAHPSNAGFSVLAPSSATLNIQSRASVREYLEDHKPDVIVHLAAVVGGIQANIDEPVRFLVANTEMALNLFQEARATGVKRVLNVTSSCMYPRNISGVLTKDLLLAAPLEPTNEGYALGKILSWKLLEYMSREEPSLIYRTILPCNLYGLHDHFDPRKSHLVPAAIMKVVEAKEQGLNQVQIWGDGTARREFMFAADLANFIWWALPRLEELPTALNVGLGQDWSVREYYEQVADLVGWDGQFVYDATKPAGMARKLLDVSEVNSLGWHAPTSLRDGLMATIQHYQATRFVNAT